MERFIEYILQFGNLNKQQIDLIKSKATEIELHKDDYYWEAGKTVKQIGFLADGVLRVYSVAADKNATPAQMALAVGSKAFYSSNSRHIKVTSLTRKHRCD